MTTYSEKIRADVEFAFSNKKNFTPHAYIDIAGDLVSGTLLARIMYWCGESEENGKLRVFKDGHYWLAKGRNDWYDEIRITPRQFDTAIAKLEARTKDVDNKMAIDETKRLVEVRVFKFNGVPTTHIRPIYKNINTAIAEWKNNLAKEMQNADNKPVISISQNCDIEVTELGFPLTENTNIDYNTENTDSNLRIEQESNILKNKDFIYTSVPSEHEESADGNVIESAVSEVVANLGIEQSEVNDITEDITALITTFGILSTDKPRNITKAGLLKIIHEYLMPPENMDDADIEDYMAMMYEYFKTDFGTRGKYKCKITKSIEHFMSDGIRSLLYERCRQNE